MGVYSMKKGEFIEYITKQTGESRQNTDRFYKAFCKGIEEQLRNGDELCLTGIGTFRIKKRQARKGINPQTKERINIPAKNVVVFKPSQSLAGSINE